MISSPAETTWPGDTTEEAVAGTVALGLVPTQAAISASLSKLLATDGHSPRIVVVDLVDGQQRSIAVDFPVQRVVLAGDGLTAALVDLAGGTVAVIDLIQSRQRSRISGLPPLRDLLLDAGGNRVYLASAGLAGIGVIDLATTGPLGEIGDLPPTAGGIAGFTRSPNGRLAYAGSTAGGLITIVDLLTGQATGRIEAGGTARLAIPSRTGDLLLIPDIGAPRLSLWQGPIRQAVLRGPKDMGWAFTAWFDTVAFVPSPGESRLAVYDLTGLAEAASIALPGRPGNAGSVSPDGATLYLPLDDADGVAVIDARRRRLTRVIGVAPHPVFAVMAGSSGICH